MATGSVAAPPVRTPVPSHLQGRRPGQPERGREVRGELGDGPGEQPRRRGAEVRRPGQRLPGHQAPARGAAAAGAAGGPRPAGGRAVSPPRGSGAGRAAGRAVGSGAGWAAGSRAGRAAGQAAGRAAGSGAGRAALPSPHAPSAMFCPPHGRRENSRGAGPGRGRPVTEHRTVHAHQRARA